MSKCEDCGREMLIADGCSKEYLIFKDMKNNTNEYHRVKVGELSDKISEDDRCHDCNARYGYYHHIGCDMERCPLCGMQLISCDCNDKYRIDTARYFKEKLFTKIS